VKRTLSLLVSLFTAVSAGAGAIEVEVTVQQVGAKKDLEIIVRNRGGQPYLVYKPIEYFTSYEFARQTRGGKLSRFRVALASIGTLQTRFLDLQNFRDWRPAVV